MAASKANVDNILRKKTERQNKGIKNEEMLKEGRENEAVKHILFRKGEENFHDRIL